MGTNFYLFTNDRGMRDRLGSNYHIVDEPDFGYEIHIAKTSIGWLPLFEGSDIIKSVKDIHNLYKSGHFKIIDEYNKEYSWAEFEERVLKFNGGIAGVIDAVLQNINSESSVFKRHLEKIPISHFNYEGGKYAYMYRKDEDGYEFCDSEFT